MAYWLSDLIIIMNENNSATISDNITNRLMPIPRLLIRAPLVWLWWVYQCNLPYQTSAWYCMVNLVDSKSIKLKICYCYNLLFTVDINIEIYIHMLYLMIFAVYCIIDSSHNIEIFMWFSAIDCNRNVASVNKELRFVIIFFYIFSIDSKS